MDKEKLKTKEARIMLQCFAMAFCPHWRFIYGTMIVGLLHRHCSRVLLSFLAERIFLPYYGYGNFKCLYRRKLHGNCFCDRTRCRGLLAGE